MPKHQLLTEPLLHFVVLGAALFGLYATTGARRGESARNDEIVVSAARVQSLAEIFSRQWGRPPTDDELSGLVRDFIREEALAREAIALGLDQDDLIVRRRLAQKMEFLSDTMPAGAPPTDEDLRALVVAHPERFRVEAHFTFDQVFLDRDQRGERLDADAAALQAALNANGAGSGLALLGDSRLLDTHFEDVGRGEVEARFGPRFVERLDTLPLGRFEWPVESGYGSHLVRVDRRTPAYVPAFDAVRDAAVREWAEVKRTESKDAQLQALLARYHVTIETGSANDADRIAEVR